MYATLLRDNAINRYLSFLMFLKLTLNVNKQRYAYTYIAYFHLRDIGIDSLVLLDQIHTERSCVKSKNIAQTWNVSQSGHRRDSKKMLYRCRYGHLEVFFFKIAEI